MIKVKNQEFIGLSSKNKEQSILPQNIYAWRQLQAINNKNKLKQFNSNMLFYIDFQGIFEYIIVNGCALTLKNIIVRVFFSARSFR